MPQLLDTTLFADANLIAYYKLEDTADSKGAYTLTNNGTVAFNAAKFENGADLGTANTTKYLSVMNDMGITNGAVSISFWGKITAEPATNTIKNLFERGDSGTDVRHRISYEDQSGVKALVFNRQRENVANDQFTYNVTLGTSIFHHFVITYDGTTVHGFLDGADIGNVASSGNGGSGVFSDYLIIGARMATQTDNTVSLYASAIIDDFAVFNRQLTAAEILDLYLGGLAILTPTQLKSYKRPTRIPGTLVV